MSSEIFETESRKSGSCSEGVLTGLFVSYQNHFHLQKSEWILTFDSFQRIQNSKIWEKNEK